MRSGYAIHAPNFLKPHEITVHRYLVRWPILKTLAVLQSQISSRPLKSAIWKKMPQEVLFSCTTHKDTPYKIIQATQPTKTVLGKFRGHPPNSTCVLGILPLVPDAGFTLLHAMISWSGIPLTNHATGYLETTIYQPNLSANNHG